ncbi:MAG: DUF1887 family CARF protein [Methylococcales bacterium]
MPSQISNHLYLVSVQATPNITPALDAMIRPDKVFLMVSPEMMRQAELLRGVLKEAAGVEVQLWTIDDAWDIEHVITRTMELLEQHKDDTFALNSTGGTRPMSIGAFQVFQAYQQPVFYVHPLDDRLIWLYPRGLAAHQLADRVRLPHFLLAHGSTLTSQGDVNVLPAYREIAELLIEHIDYFSKAITTLNWYATQTVDRKSPQLKPEHLRWDALLDLLDRLQIIDVVDYQSKHLVFPNNAAKHFVNGGWLEQYVYAELLQIRQKTPEIQDIAQTMSVTRQSLGQTIHNELDVAFLCNNHFFVVECKTMQLDQQSSQAGTETIYKLDSLKELLGGFSGQGMLVSYKPMSTADKHRAADLGIEVCDDRNLQDLRSRLIQWMSKAVCIV